MTMIVGMAFMFFVTVLLVGGAAFWFVTSNAPEEPARAAASIQTVAVVSKVTETRPAPLPEATTKAPPQTQPEPNTTKPSPPPPPPPVVVRPGDGSLPPAVLKQVKRATVYLRVKVPGSANPVQGSGFFGIEPGIVLTNAHVLGMLRPLSPRPERVDVVLNSGQTDERTLPGQILQVDAGSDLAVIRVKGDRLPSPLAVQEAKELQETQAVYVCGFPLGQQLGKEISIRKSSVASLRRENGVLDRVQLEGGMDPGNSGGPIIDTRGHVVGVAVSGIVGRTINFAIPGENVHALFFGRVSKVAFGHPYRQGAQVKLPASVELLDPFQRVQKVAVDVWTGQPGDPRSGSLTPPRPQQGDSPRRQSALSYRGGKGSGEIMLPALPDGQVYWFQVIYVNGSGKSRWSQANVWETVPPLERQPVRLPLGQKTGSQPLEMVSQLTLRREVRGGEDTLAIGFRTFLQEVVKVDGQGASNIQLQYQRMVANVSQNGRPPKVNTLQQVAPLFNRLGGLMRVNRDGSITANQVDASRLPPNVNPQAKDILNTIGRQLQELLQATYVPLPNTTASPGQSWTARRNLPIDALGKYDTCFINMKYTFLGVRTSNGKKEAVIELAGDVRPSPGINAKVNGNTTGTAIVDLASGLVTSVKSSTTAELDITANNRRFRAGATLDLNLARGGVVP